MRKLIRKLQGFWKKGKLHKIFTIIVLCSIFIILYFSINPPTVKYKFSSNENLSITLEQHNTDEALNEITHIASNNLKDNHRNKSMEVINNGLYYIKENINNLASNNTVMEKSLYYSYYIYNYIELNSNNIKELNDEELAAYNIGYYTFTYVKYKYRNVEGWRDNQLDIVKNNLSKLN